MSAHSKDSAEVIKFMTLFEKLKDWSDNEPESLPKLADADEGVKNLCISLCGAAHTLTMNERRRRELFAAPVDQKFLDAWRDYEDRFAKPVGAIWLDKLIPDLGNAEPEPLSQAELNWDYANDDGARQAAAIEMRSSLPMSKRIRTGGIFQRTFGKGSMTLGRPGNG